MSEAEVIHEEGAPASRRGKLLPVLIGVGGALALGAGSFAAVYTGMLDGFLAKGDEVAAAGPPPVVNVGFVALEPITVSLAPGGAHRHLRFRAELEIVESERAAVELLRPRILDTLNGYLRALEPDQFEQPATLAFLRAQMLRRIGIVVGEGRVRDLLVLEFVLN